MQNVNEITHWKNSFSSTVNEFFIVIVAGSATLLWYFLKKLKLGSIIRETTFSALTHIKKRIN